jgi:hypothetical protein
MKEWPTGVLFMLNRYQKAAQAIIDEKMKVPLHLIVNRNGERASWDNHHWTITNLDGTSIKCPLHNIVIAPRHRAKVVPLNAQYPDIVRHIIMCYTLEWRTINGANDTFKLALASARHLAAHLNLFSFSQQTLTDLINTHEKTGWVKPGNAFIAWLQKHCIVPKTIKYPSISAILSDGGDDIKARREKNMPDDRALWAMGAIRNKIIPSDVPKGVYQHSLRDELVISSATLGLASPQRSAKEQFVLPKTTLQSKMVKFDGKEQKVHWIDWQGSKGYEANRKHFFRGAAEPAEAVLNYWNEVGEPARILCRFFEKPTSKLCDLLGDYKPLSHEQFDLNKPIDNMFALGYLLGFYEGQQQTVTLTPGSVNTNNRPTKQIQALTREDKINVSLHTSEVTTLFGTMFFTKKSNPIQYGIFKGVNTIAQLQEKWITYIKQMTPTFPWRVAGQNKVKIRHALFIGTGAQMTIKSRQNMGTSYYAIESMDFGALVRSGLRNNKSETIFERHGFASDIDLNPYQLRHWSNTMMQKSIDMSDAVIAMVSGRKDIKQNGEYDNQTNDEKMQRVQNLFRKEQTIEEMKQEVRVVGHNEYQEATGKASTITSTGICTQQLAVNPCHYLNDFETHCSLCTSSCHFAHDEKAIHLLKDDLRIQEARLQAIKDDEYLHTNKMTQAWFLRHHKNTFLLEKLITLMQREDLKIGTAIKFVNKNSSFRLTDLDKRVVEEVKVLLPDSQKALLQLIEAKQPEAKAPTKDEQNLASLFADFGIEGVL